MRPNRQVADVFPVESVLGLPDVKRVISRVLKVAEIPSACNWFRCFTLTCTTLGTPGPEVGTPCDTQSTLRLCWFPVNRI